MRIVLSTSASTPIYQQIKEQVRAAILSGLAAPGDTLPSLRQLAADLRISVISVTRAYNDLVAEGLVRNEHGRGFVVLEVDQTAARAALAARVDEALRALATAARNAHMTKEEIHDRFDAIWNDAE
ncbi:GntR family transcriptional regulator [Agrococcus sp. 1P02AA]|uniref:GntR family transcriptional regulator n=1 Tax=Agrococcus sp. 1P02AA TaxID=3132259 RepID=UPI0039A4BA6E